MVQKSDLPQVQQLQKWAKAPKFRKSVKFGNGGRMRAKQAGYSDNASDNTQPFFVSARRLI
jgi:hypothetical protein